MQFYASKCVDALPGFDMITFTVNFGNNDEYQRFCQIAEAYGVKVVAHKAQSGLLGKRISELGIYIMPHTYKQRGWGRVYFQATLKNLLFFEQVCWDYCAGNMDLLKALVKLNTVELAYDFLAPSSSCHVAVGIVKRLLHRIWPKNGQSLYGVFISQDLVDKFEDLDELLEEYGKCEDGAINGDLTAYIQQCKRKDTYRSSESLDPNPRASKHTKIYAKKIDGKWYVRIELTLKKGTLQDNLPLDYLNFAALLDYLNDLPLSKFYEFREADFATFIRKLNKLPEAEIIKGDHDWDRRIEEVPQMTFADQLRMMRVLADEVGNKRLKNSILSKYTKELDVSEAISKRLPHELTVARRTPKGEVPSGIPMQEDFSMLINIGKRELLPLAGIGQKPPQMPF